MKQQSSSTSQSNRKPKQDYASSLTKYGGWHWILMHMPMRGQMPIKMDGSQYSDDPYEIYNHQDDEEPSKIFIAGPKEIESFVLSCRCNDKDNLRWQEAVKLDMQLYEEDRHHVDDFFKTVKLEPKPVRGGPLCEMLQAGSIVMVTEITEYFIITHIGNDFTNLFKPKIQEYRRKGICSYSVTRKAFSAQRASRCRTCFGDDVGMAICDACVATCHKGHDTYVVVKPKKIKRNGKGKTKKSRGQRWTVPKTLMYCDCGYKLDCQCR